MADSPSVPPQLRDAIEAELDLLMDAPVWVDAVCAVIEAHLERLGFDVDPSWFRWLPSPRKDTTDE